MKIFIVLLLWAVHLAAVTTKDSKETVTWEIDSYYQDNMNQLRIHDIISADTQSKFQSYPTKNAVFSRAYSQSTYWIKVKLHNTTSSTEQRDFQLDHSWLDKVNLYLIKDSQIIHTWNNGDKVPYNPSYNKSLHPHITLNIPNGDSILYIEFSSEEPLIVPFHIDTSENINQATLYKLSFFAAIYAAIFIMALYHLLLFFSSKDKNYLFYTFFLFSFIATNSSYNGFQYHLFLHHSLFLPSFINAFYIFTYQYIGILFVMSFLQTKHTMPKVHRFLLLFILVDIMIQVITFIFDFEHFMQASSVVSMTLFGPMLFAISLYALKNFTESNRLFALGLFFSLIGSTITALCAYGLLPYTFYYFHAVEFGFIIDAVLISLALASKLKYISNQLEQKVTELKAKSLEIQQEIQARLASERVSYENSKLANLGEMIGNIAHQWRQPLAQLSYVNAYLHKELAHANAKVGEKLIKTDSILEFMSDTLTNFQNFYSNKKEESNFKPSNALKTVLDIMNDSLELHSIKIILEVDHKLHIYGNENNYAQVILALLQNSLKVIEQRTIKNAFIKISIEEKNAKCHLLIKDNAGGISMQPIETIFDIFVSNSDASSTGIGLYMTKKIIVQKFKGTIEVQNTSKGALFIIVV